MKTKTKLFYLLLCIACFESLTSCKTACCTTYSGVPANIISADQAIAMKRNYAQNIAPVIEKHNGNGYQATDFVWMDYQTLKQYVALLDEVNALNKEKISGLRIYFAQTPSPAEIKKNGYAATVPNRETVFMAPTVKVASSELSKQFPNLENLPFAISPEGSDPLKGDFIPIEDLLSTSDNKTASQKLPLNNKKGPSTTGFTTTATTLATTSLIIDNFSLTPPPK